MGEGSVFIEIVVFAMIAAFLVFRLRSVLGRRNGEERQRPNPYAAPRPGQDLPDNVVVLPERGRTADATAEDEGPPSLAVGLARIKAADPSFEEKPFVQGAQSAFEMIVQAFAKGDTTALRPLLSDDVYDNFAAAIRSRTAAGETLETRVERIKDADLLEARMEGRNAVITAKFVSDQVNVTRDTAGTVVDGDPERVQEVTDIWTFARDTRSRDPNWLLVETRTPN